ncbi:MAG: DUF5011 domain-containing protein [Cytophagales bacterium]|nr:DUF5011 domain-containing protein [Cytophagales bacterium]
MMKQLFKRVMRTSIVLVTIFVLSCKDDPEAIPEVTSSFTQVVDNTTGVVNFKNTSENATSYLWDLNDGTTSTLFEPTNTYQTGTYTVKLTASNSAGGTATSENTFTVTLPVTVDTTKPIITLTGEATINLTVGDPYIDKGATANDNLDGNVTAKIVKGGDAVNTATPGTYVITYNVTDEAGNAAIPVTRSVIVTAFDDGLLTNGAFSSTTEAWSGNGFNVLNEGGTNFNFVNVETAGDAFNVNLSQVLPLVQGKNYILSFEASSDRARTMLAGIGLSVDPFTNDSKTVNLTTTKQTITLELSAVAFGGANSRVLFDMGAAVGVVVIDNVKLVEGAATPCTAETTQSLSAADFNLTFETDPGSVIINDNAGYVYSANPNIANTVNTSCFVGKSVKTAGNLYGNNQIIVDAKFNFNTSSGFKMKVYSAVAGSKVLLKLEDKNNGGISTEVLKTVAQANVWEELTFDFAANQSNKYDRIVLFADFEGNAASTVYFDDLKLYGTGTPSSPTTAAPTPPARVAGDVISIYGEAYATLAGTNYNPDWGQSGLAFTNPSFNPGNGNLVLAYPNFNYQGTQLASNVDASAMNFLHVDIWVASGTDRLVKVSPINNGGVIEVLVNVPLTPGAWNSVDLPKSSFTGMTWDAVKELKFDGQFNGNGSANTTPFDIYLDNIYFLQSCWWWPRVREEICITNGGFETGDITGWTSFAAENNGTFAASNAQAKTGTYSGLLVADVPAGGGPASFPVAKAANVGVGTITPNKSVTVTFDLYGSVAGAGGVVFVELFSELTGGGTSKAEILGGGPLFPNGTWTSKSFTTTVGNDVSGGITVQLKADCGANPGCRVEAYFDNVSVVINP